MTKTSDPCMGGSERRVLLAVAVSAAVAAGDVVTEESQRYAECAVTLLKAAIGAPMTLAQVETLLEKWTPRGTALEQSFCEAIACIKSRRALLEEGAYLKGQS